MKTKAISSLFVLFAIAAGIVAMTPAAFADHSEVTVTPVAGSSAMGCEETPEGCYTPSTATVDLGGVVIFSNTDSMVHTFSAGTPTGTTGEFETSMVMAGQSYEWTADVLGEIDYFCMVHPWMIGQIIVQEAGALTAEEAAAEEAAAHAAEEAAAHAAEEAAAHAAEEAAALAAEEAAAHAAEEAAALAAEEAAALAAEEAAAEPELIVVITDSAVLDGTQIELDFSELHVNYDIIATQNGEVIFEETGLHSMEHIATHQIDAVGSDENPIDVEVISLGIGAPGNEADWTGPTGSVATAKVVPEFGTIAMMILAVAIISIVAITAKSRVIPRF
jgi:predicted secreted protein with PEFG-CTERM motif